MKKAILVAAGVVLLMACNQTKDSSTTNDSMDHKPMNDNMAKFEAAVKNVYHAFETGDMSKMDSLLDKNYVDHDNGPNGKDIAGLDSAKHYYSQFHNYFDNLKFDILRNGATADGDYYFSEVRMTGKAKQNPWGIPVSSDVDDTTIDLVKMKDGKATDHWGFTSDKDVHERMMGMMQGNKPMMKDSTHH